MQMANNYLFAICFIFSGLQQVSGDCLEPGKITLHGDVYIVGFYSGINNSSANDDYILRLHLKFRYFIARQYSKGMYSCRTFYPRVGFVAYDICDNATKLNEALVDLYLNPRFKCARCSCASNKICTGPPYTRIFAVFSYMPKHLTRIAADMMEIDDIPYFAYTDTHMNHYGNFYRNFYSTYDIINNEVSKTYSEINAQNLKNIILIHFAADSSNITKLHLKQLLDILTKGNRYCVKMKSIKNDKISDSILKSINNTKTELIIIWSTVEQRKMLLETIDRENIRGKTWFWYSTEHFNLSIDATVRNWVTENMYVFFHPLHAFQTLHEKIPYALMYMKTRCFFQTIYNDPWVKILTKKYNINPRVRAAFGRFDTINTREEEYLENLLLVIWWTQPFKKLEIANMSRYREFVHSIAGRRTYTMKSRIKGEFQEIDLTQENMKTNKSKSCERIRCSGGLEPKHNVWNSSKWDVLYSWRCSKCSNNSYKSHRSNKACQQCPINQISTPDRSQCFDPFKNIYLRYDDTRSLIVICLLTIAIAFNIFALATFVTFKDTPIVRSSNFRTSVIHLLFHMALYISLPLMFIGEPTLLKCMCQSAVTGFLLTIITSITLKKTQQLLFAFQANRKLTRENIFMSEAVELAVVLFLVLIQIVLCIIYFLENRPELKISMDYKNIERHISCYDHDHVDFQLYYIFALCLFCTIQGLRARNLPKYFNETKYIAFSMFVSIIILSIKFPLYHSYNEPEVKSIINFTVILLVNTAQLVIMYAHKLHTVLFQSHRNTKEAFRMGMMNRSRVSTKMEIFY